MKNEQSINPRERRAKLDSKYSTVIKQELNDITVEDIRTLITDLITQNFLGNKKDLRSGYTGKARILLDKFGNKLEYNEMRRLRYSEIIASCSNKWIEGLRNLGIKQISVGAQYDNTGLYMITSKSTEVKALNDAIFKDFKENRNWELSRNQMHHAFDFAATRLGILNVDRLPNYTRIETIKSVNKIQDSQFRGLEVTFGSGGALKLSHLDPKDIQKGYYFEITYSDSQCSKNLETTLRDSSGKEVKSWISQEYKENKDSDKAKLVAVEK